LRIAISAEHPLAARETIALAELDRHELLLPSEDSGREWNQFVARLRTSGDNHPTLDEHRPRCDGYRGAAP
jgi:hypothetical protein